MGVAPVFLAAIAFIAGHPTTVVCDANTNPSPFASPGYTATAWTYTGASVIHADPVFCSDTNDQPGNDGFARAIDVFLHEAARARGIQSDSCVELVSDVGVYDVLRRFWNVPFFSGESERIGAQVLALTRTLPATFQPESCWSSGVLR